MAMTKEQEEKRKKFMEERTGLNKEQRQDLAKSESKNRYFTGAGQVSKDTYEIEKGKTGQPTDPALSRIQAKNDQQQKSVESMREQAAYPTLKEAGVFEDRPINEEILAPQDSFFSREGMAQRRDQFLTPQEIQNRAYIEAERQQALARLQNEEASRFKIASTESYYKHKQFWNNLIPSVKATGYTVIETGGEIPVLGDVVNAFLRNPRENTSNLQASIVTYAGVANDIGAAMRDGTLSPEDGLKQLLKIEQAVDNAEAQIKNYSIKSITLQTSGDLQDVQTDILETRQAIYDNKRLIAGQYIQETDPEVINYKLKLLQEKYNSTK